MAEASSLSTNKKPTFEQWMSVSLDIHENTTSRTLVWLDPNIDIREDTKGFMDQLRQIDDHVVFHTEFEECLAFIRSIKQQGKIFLIISGAYALSYLPQIAILPQINSLWIYCMNKAKYEHLANEYSQIIGIYAQPNELCQSVQEAMASVFEIIHMPKVIDYHRNPGRYKALSIVVVSDTHNNHEVLEVPEGDIFLHCGDFTDKSDWDDQTSSLVTQSTIAFNRWLGTLPHRYKIVICGNHEVGFGKLSKEKIQTEVLTNCLYLKNELIEIEGLSIYGASWSFTRHQKTMWPLIPSNIDILMTHVPPEFILDLAYESEEIVSVEPCLQCGGQVHDNYQHWGSQSLAREVNQRIKPRVHCFGHVHDSRGYTRGKNNEETLFINASADIEPKCYKFVLYADLKKYDSRRN